MRLRGSMVVFPYEFEGGVFSRFRLVTSFLPPPVHHPPNLLWITVVSNFLFSSTQLLREKKTRTHRYSQVKLVIGVESSEIWIIYYLHRSSAKDL